MAKAPVLGPRNPADLRDCLLHLKINTESENDVLESEKDSTCPHQWHNYFQPMQVELPVICLRGIDTPGVFIWTDMRGFNELYGSPD